MATSIHETPGRLVFLNQAARALLGIEQTPEVEGNQLTSVFQVYQTETSRPYVAAELPAIKAFEGENVYVDNIELRQPNQTIPLEVWAFPVFNEQGSISHSITVFQDISDRQRTEARLVHNALHDTLTNLPNRSFLLQRLELAINRASQAKDYAFAILFLDLDRFKVINDNLGNSIGDELLKAVAHKLQNAIQLTDLAARVGGDEFVVLLEEIEDIQSVIRITENILVELKAITHPEVRHVLVSASIGVVWGSSDYKNAASLLRDAEIALNRAQARSRGRYEVFDSEVHTQVLERMQLENALLRGFAHQEFDTYYQPIFSIDKGYLVGFEALARWRHPTKGFISPADFIHIAEESGLITSLDHWMLQKACEQLAFWHQQFPQWKHLRMCVNFSGKELQESSLVETIKNVLAQTGVPANCLTLEITENVLIQNISQTIEMLHKLKSHGIQISIDDFGTGYSSLSYLHHLPANSLKIDKSFISRMRKNGRDYKISQAIIALSNQLQMNAIAEGIETFQQLQWLREMGCEQGQGYLVSQPLPPEEAARRLATLDPTQPIASLFLA